MSSTSGGRWVFSAAQGSGFNGVVVGINNGVAPVFPGPQPGALNIEVFTNPTVSGIRPPDPGFQVTITDPGGTLDPSGPGGFLTGTNLLLGSGDYLAVDSVAGNATTSGLQSPSKITLGTGNQTVVGAKFDTLVGGSGTQILSALVGNETVVGGSGNESIWGGANDSIVAGTGNNQQIVSTSTGTTVVAGLSGNAVVSLGAQNTVTSLAGSTQNIVIAAGVNNLIDLTGNKSTGASAVTGASGDTITAGSGTTNINGGAGGMLIKVGAGGLTALTGSTNVAAGNTVTGGAGNFNFNPGATAGKGELINLSGSTGAATINAFSFGATRVASADTILAGNNADSIFGGAGDRIGTGSVQGAGSHQWVHADTVAGTTVGFGTNSSVAGSTAQVTVGGFNETTDFLFYQNETAATNQQIVATSTPTTIVTANDSTRITLPDGTVMTLVGVTQVELNAALTAGTLFKP
jgi:hypothetical protein